MQEALTGQHQRHHAWVFMEQPARGERERFGTGRRQRLHLDGGVLVGRNRIGPLFHGHRLQPGRQDERVGMAQVVIIHGAMHKGFDIIAGWVGQDQGRPPLDC